MKDSRSLIRNSVRSSERLFVAWITSTLNSEAPNATGPSEWAEHRVERRATALRSVAIGERCVQVRPEDLEIHHPGERLELVADVAQSTQALIQIEQSRLPLHVSIPAFRRIRESRTV